MYTLGVRRLTVVLPFAALSAIVSVLCLAACGVRSPLTDDLLFARVDAAADAPPPDATPRDAGITDAEIDAPPDVALPPTDLGNVFLSSGAYQQGDADVFVTSAAFFADVLATGCDVRALGPSCTIETCSGGGSTSFSSAGSIAVIGGKVPVVMQQGPTGDYNAAGSTSLWLGGEALTVAASGADVPSFAAHVVAPTQVVFTAPLPQTIDRSAPFPLEWAGTSAGKIAFELTATSGGTKSILECTFDVAAQKGVVPVSALNELPGGASGGLTISTLVESDVYAGPWLVKTFAQTVASDPAGNECSVISTLR